MPNIKIAKNFILVMLIGFTTVSCEYGRQAEEQLSDFNSTAGEFEKMVNDGIENVSALDSILPETSKKLKTADSIIDDASSTLDSLKQKADRIQNIFN